MNYTEKFHFPQWEENDRVLREDFNSAMAVSEAGLARAQDALFRLAYNRFHYVRTLKTPPRQIGYFRQGFDGNSSCSVTGMIGMEDRKWMGNGEKDLALEQFRDTVQASGSMSGYGISFYFTPGDCGWITGIRLSGSYVIASEFGVRHPGTVTLYNMTAGRTEWTGTGTLVLPQVGLSTGTYEITGVRAPVIGGCRYFASFQITNGKGTPTLTVDPGSNCLSTDKMHMASARAEARIYSEEESQGGLALVRTSLWGTGAELALDWDGEILKPWKIRRTVFDGKYYDEAEFRRWSPVPAESRLALNIGCNPGGAIDLYEWGAMLI